MNSFSWLLEVFNVDSLSLNSKFLLFFFSNLFICFLNGRFRSICIRLINACTRGELCWILLNTHLKFIWSLLKTWRDRTIRLWRRDIVSILTFELRYPATSQSLRASCLSWGIRFVSNTKFRSRRGWKMWRDYSREGSLIF